MEAAQKLDDPSNYTGTGRLLTLPLSDFPNTNTSNAAATSTAASKSNNENRDDDDLILISIPPTKDNSGLTMEDLIRGENIYILGDTSEKDIPNHTSLPPEHNQQQDDSDTKSGVGGSIEPIAARLIVEGDKSSSHAQGKTMELTRVETSNTYIVVPPMLSKENDESAPKRQKLDDDNNKKKELVTMPARSIGLIPGEDSPSCFFLDPAHLQPGHFANKLRGSLSRWMYDPFDPPAAAEEKEEEGGSAMMFGYTIPELAHICRTSLSEIEYAMNHRVFGAVDGLAIPSSSSDDNAVVDTRYGMLSEEGRQTIQSAIVTALIESDLELVYEEESTKEGMQLSSLLEEIRSHWHRLEGGDDSNSVPQPQMEEKQPSMTDSQSQYTETQSQFGTPSQLPVMTNTHQMQLADEVIWHCLRPILHYNDITSEKKDMMPETVKLIPDEVAKLAAHNVFLRGTPRSSSAATSQQIGAGSAVWWEEEELMEAWSMRLPSMSSKYEPKVELLKGIAISGMKEKDGDNAQQIRRWQYFPEEGLAMAQSLRLKSMFKIQDSWALDEAVPYLEKFVVGDEKVADLLEKHAKARDGKYVAKLN